MLIQNWMTQHVITVTPETSMLKAGKLMREHNIRRLPVIDTHNTVIGIISDRDIRDASPSKATTLDMHEMYYLLAELKVRDVMTKNPVTLNAQDTVDVAAKLMHEKKFGGMPVINEHGTLAGIITDQDVFKAFLRFTGSRRGGLLLGFELLDESGIMRPIFNALYDHKANIISMLTTRETPNKMVSAYVRIHPLPLEEEEQLLAFLKDNFNLVFWRRDEGLPPMTR